MKNLMIKGFCAAALGLAFGARADAMNPNGAPDTQIIHKLHHTNLTEISLGQLAEKQGSTAGVRSYGRMLEKDHQQAEAALGPIAAEKGVTFHAIGYAGMADVGARDAKTPGADQDAAANSLPPPAPGAGPTPNDRDAKIAGADQDAAQQHSETPIPVDSAARGTSQRDAKVPGGDQDGAKRMAGMNDGLAPGAKHADDKAMIESLKTLHGRDFDRAFLAMMVDGHQDVIDQVKAARSSLNDGDHLATLLDNTLPTLRQHRERAKMLLDKMGPQARRMN